MEQGVWQEATGIQAGSDDAGSSQGRQIELGDSTDGDEDDEIEHNILLNDK